MHPYSVSDANNADQRVGVYYRIVAVSAVVGLAISALLVWLANWGVAIGSSAPSTIVIYGVLVSMLERKLWRLDLVRCILGIETPDLNGSWPGVVHGTNEDGTPFENKTGLLTVEQTWRKIAIRFQTDLSESQSEAVMIVVRGRSVDVFHQYKSRRRRPARDDFRDHDGAGVLCVDFDCPDYREIEYYTNDREVGTIELSRSLNN